MLEETFSSGTVLTVVIVLMIVAFYLAARKALAELLLQLKSEQTERAEE